jgi:thioredoxin reductase
MGSLIDIPKAAAVMGGGVIAVEYATVLAQLGVGVSLICRNEEFLPFLDRELRYQLRKRMKQDHVLFVSNTVKSITIDHITATELASEAAINPISWQNGIVNASSIVRIYLNNDEEPPFGLNTSIKQSLNRVLKVDLLLYSGKNLVIIYA